MIQASVILLLFNSAYMLIILLVSHKQQMLLIISRYLQPPSEWVHCALESRELLALCLKKLKTLNTVKLIDAGFVWTEPHSKRIKVNVHC